MIIIRMNIHNNDKTATNTNTKTSKTIKATICKIINGSNNDRQWEIVAGSARWWERQWVHEKRELQQNSMGSKQQKW